MAEKVKESGPKVMVRSTAIAYIILAVVVGIIAGFTGGLNWSNAINREALSKRNTSPGKPGAPAAQGGDDMSQMDMVRKHLDALKQQAAKDPKDVQSRVELGNMYFEIRRMDQAIEWYKQALDIDPSNVNVRTDMANAYSSLGQFDKAEAEMQKALAVNPNHVLTIVNYGILKLRSKGDKQGALQLWEKALGMNSSDLQPNQVEQIRHWIQDVKEGKNPFQGH